MSTQQIDQRVAVVTRANRGIGLAIARQGMTVVVTSRDLVRGEESVARLRDEGTLVAAQLDVSDGNSVASLATLIEQRFGRLDILINNAGAAFDWTPEPTQPSRVTLDAARMTFETNFFGPLAVTQALLPLLRKSPAGRIVNIASRTGSLTELARPDSPHASMVAPMYQASKAALNALTLLFARELRGTAIKVNSACPGWVDSDGGVPAWLRAALGGHGTAIPVDQGADTPVWLATLPEDGPSGGFFYERKPFTW